MNPGFFVTVLLASVVAFLVIQPSGRAADEKTAANTTAPAGPEITLIGSLLDQRACVPPVWDYKQTGDHTLVLFAIDGTPQVKAELDSIMKEYWPGDALDCDQAVKLADQFNQRLKYYLVSSPLVDAHRKEVQYPSEAVSVTGTVSERDGKKWIDVTKISKLQPQKLSYPEKMLAPDKPMVMPEKEPLVLKVTDTTTLKCIKLPAGKFLCGSPLYIFPRWQDEFPHQVVLTHSFYMSEIPITQAMFEAVVGTNPSKRTPEPWKTPKDKGFYERMRHAKPDDGPDFAVENATWAEIQKFCQVLSDKNGRKVRLPTDAEWEYAARVGTSSPSFTEKYLDQRSFVADHDGKCEPVKLHQPNAWGLYDMIKSGWELCSDYKADNVREDKVDPQGPPRKSAANHGNGPLHRTKGGSYRGDTHVNLHGACDEEGNNEEGIMIFRVVVEDSPATPATAPN